MCVVSALAVVMTVVFAFVWPEVATPVDRTAVFQRAANVHTSDELARALRDGSRHIVIKAHMRLDLLTSNRHLDDLWRVRFPKVASIRVRNSTCIHVSVCPPDCSRMLLPRGGPEPPLAPV